MPSYFHVLWKAIGKSKRPVGTVLQGSWSCTLHVLMRGISRAVLVPIFQQESKGLCCFLCAGPLPMDSCSGSDHDAAAIWSQVWALGATHVPLMMLERLLVKSSLTKLPAKSSDSLVTKTLCNIHPSSRSSQRYLMNYFVVDTGQNWCPEFMKRRWKPRTTRWAGGGSPYTPLTWAGKICVVLLPHRLPSQSLRPGSWWVRTSTP